MFWLVLFSSLLAALGLVQALGGWLAVCRFARRRDTAAALLLPRVTILKPLHGDEPLLEEALAAFCAQDYPDYQIVFGVQDLADPALHVVQRLRQRFPERDIELVADSTPHGSNRKIANLINMFPAARHDVLVMADADVHVAPDYLRHVMAALHQPGTGLVTTLYSGLPADRGLPALLGAGQISHVFLPGALMARALGRQDCLGATMALRRETLAAVGGFAALANHLADDAVLGHLVGERGLAVRLAATVPATTVAETGLGALFQHELRWARTIHSVAPLGHALSAIQYPLFWALLAVLLSGGDRHVLALFALSWLVRFAASRGIERRLGLASVPPWLLPLRDVMSIAVMAASYRGNQVRWRGQVMRADRRAYRAAVYATAERMDAI